MTYGYTWGPKNYAGVAFVRAAKSWPCDGALTETDEDDGFQGLATHGTPISTLR